MFYSQQRESTTEEATQQVYTLSKPQPYVTSYSPVQGRAFSPKDVSTALKILGYALISVTSCPLSKWKTHSSFVSMSKFIWRHSHYDVFKQMIELLRQNMSWPPDGLSKQPAPTVFLRVSYHVSETLFALSWDCPINCTADTMTHLSKWSTFLNTTSSLKVCPKLEGLANWPYLMNSPTSSSRSINSTLNYNNLVIYDSKRMPTQYHLYKHFISNYPCIQSFYMSIIVMLKG